MAENWYPRCGLQGKETPTETRYMDGGCEGAGRTIVRVGNALKSQELEHILDPKSVFSILQDPASVYTVIIIEW